MDHKFIKYALFGLSVVVASEITYSYIRRWMARCAQIRASQSDREINEVVWINEHTQDCAVKTNQNSPKYYHKGNNCKNMFCFHRNIQKLVKYIDNAKRSIDLSMYIFTSHDLGQALQRAIKRGLQIRIVSDTEMCFSSRSQITDLTKSGIPVRFPNATNMLMHHKFCIIDGPVRSRALSKNQKTSVEDSQSLLLTGSLNWTHQAFNANFENMIITSNGKLIEMFELEFERMWLSFNGKPLNEKTAS